MANYFLVSVSNRVNLDLCLHYALAGFTSSINGLWAFLEIEAGDFLSFLYGAKVYNLYQVERKLALRGAEKLGPWPPVTFKMSGKTYYFPFRLWLHPVRRFEESLVRNEFAYVAENLLLRGGYAKTHFQADQTTLQAASQMGDLYSKVEIPWVSDDQAFTPRLEFGRRATMPLENYPFREVILQAAARKYLSDVANRGRLLSAAHVTSVNPDDLEVLGERALPEGHIDILMKEAIPLGSSRKLAVEVKTGNANTDDVEQLRGYVKVIGAECQAGLLIAKGFTRDARQAAKESGLIGFTYSFDLPPTSPCTFPDLVRALNLTPLA